ncbi:NLI interacting factor-like phosphatase [Hygrophoropsis aurantiaca]|uniref:NLI interacting factor-like phosphatase n=1 Tax=Hygrophoropsis aurantiaca TaxID=72124 RepID=A0ACB8A6Z0_9AGAM|nr:NLI interacting factor-like phosphatase [Hygrophoropsis aurantiaca]
MNSLAYISRQFDVLASPRAPPSTPTDEHGPFFRSSRLSRKRSDGSLKRISTWSTKSFLLSPSPESNIAGPSRPKRSYSSPSGFLEVPFVRKFPLSTTSEPPIRIKRRLRVRSALRRFFIIKIFVVVWNTLCATWASWIPQEVETEQKEVRVELAPDVSVTDVKQESIDDAVSLSELQPPLHPSIPPRSPGNFSPIFQISPKTEAPSLPTPPPSPSPESPLLAPPQPQIVIPADTSRSSTPNVATRKTPFHFPKTLVLDLDETLIHSTSKPISYTSGGLGLLGFSGFGRRNNGRTVEVVLGGRSTLYHVYKRPFVDYFLRKVSGWYTLVVFTASMQEYADPVIDWLDAGRGILAQRFFRESCTLLPNGTYTKDLSVIEQDLSRVCLIDNSPVSYRINEANGIPIEGWTHDPSDEALLDLLPILDSLRFTGDVRRVLGIRGFLS